MITGLSFALVLAAASAPQDGQSVRIMDPDHRYEWVLFDEREGLRVWWDRNARGRIIFEHREYPVVLLRAITGTEEEPGLRMDIVNAVDCEANRVANIRGYFPFQAGIVERDLTFAPWPGPEREQVGMLMREVCSEEWGR